MLSESVLEDPDIRTKSLIGFNLSSLEGPRGSPRPWRVLVVDDTAMCRGVAAAFIRSGYRRSRARMAATALSKHGLARRSIASSAPSLMCSA
jgi:hypothetical protein